MNFSNTLVSWYEKNKRELPWRNTKDPYRIWLSEVILQQTRVTQGLPYYLAFVKKFPSIHHLARAKEDEVMKAWQGLGYYSRARNLHYTAKYISKRLCGEFPEEIEEIKKLKGVGEYTAAAIASFAFNKPHPVMDGNVFRVLSRIFGIKISIHSAKGKKAFREKAEELIDKKNPRVFNQAIMEFGALHCVPKSPNCTQCPFIGICVAYKKKLISQLPVKPKNNKIQKRFFNYLVINKGEKILIKKRTDKDIWKNLYDFPLIETKRNISMKELSKFPELAQIKIKSVSPVLKHILSHQSIFARFWEVEGTFLGHPKNLVCVPKTRINNYAFPKLIERYLFKKGWLYNP